MAQNPFHAEMALLIRREKELEKELNELAIALKTWRDRIQMAADAGRDELADQARAKLEEIKTEALMQRQELQSVQDKKKKLRRQSRRPSGQEVRRSKAILDGFRESGLVDPEEAEMDDLAKETRAQQDLDALKSQMDPSSTGAGEKQTPSSAQPEPDPEDALDDELAALRAQMGLDEADDAPDDGELAELEELLSADDEPDDEDNDADDEDAPSS